MATTSNGAESGFDKVVTVRRVKTIPYVVPLNLTKAAKGADLRGFAEYGLVIPSVLTSTTITFEVSADGTLFQPLYDATNALVTMTVAPSRSYILPLALKPWAFLKVVTGTNEAAARTLTLVASA